MDATPRRQTLATAFELEGHGVHSGAAATVVVAPAPFHEGISLDGIPLSTAYVSDTRGATSLFRDGRTLVGVEHLLAAFHGLGITDATVTVHGPELPILDGSAMPWVEAIRQAGLTSGPPALVLRCTRPVRVHGPEGAWAELSPADVGQVHVNVDFGAALSGTASVRFDDDSFVRDIAWARTFAMARDVERLQAAGRGKGANAANTVVYGDKGPQTIERGPLEGVRHKLLDALGDLAFLPARLAGRVDVHKGSHELHISLVKAVRASPQCWRLEMR